MNRRRWFGIRAWKFHFNVVLHETMQRTMHIVYCEFIHGTNIYAAESALERNSRR